MKNASMFLAVIGAFLIVGGGVVGMFVLPNPPADYLFLGFGLTIAGLGLNGIAEGKEKAKAAAEAKLAGQAEAYLHGSDVKPLG